MRMGIKKKWWIYLLSVLFMGVFGLILPKNNTLFGRADTTATYNEWVIEEDTVVSYLGAETQVIVPHSHNGVQIKKIGDSAFANNQMIVSVEIPETIVQIGDKAFENCSKLTSIELPDSLELIGDYAFSSCVSLKEIAIPGTVESLGGIGGYIFSGCENLETVTLEDGVKSIGEYAFYECKNLINITLPSTLEKIDTWAFGYCEKIEAITLPNNLKTIGSASFYYCNALNNLVMPNTLEGIGTHSFRGCWSLSNLTLSTSLKTIPYRAFSGCTSLTSLELFEGLQSIGDEAFYQSGLQFFDSPNTLVSIGERAFFECQQLTNFQSGEGLKTLGAESFYACSKLSSVDLSGAIEEIPQKAFYNCSSLKSLEISNFVQFIGAEAFRGCAQLANVVFPNALRGVGDAAFYNTSLEMLELPANLEAIGKEAFAGNDDLLNVTLPSSLRSLQEGVFINCTNLKEVVFADGLAIIADKVFKNCTKLTQILFPNTLTEIGKNSFENCIHLTSIYLPTSLQDIGENAFNGCYRLVEIFNLSSLPIELGGESYGGIGAYAQCLHTSIDESSCISIDEDGFVFYANAEKALLMAYLGEQIQLVLPTGFLNNTYEIAAYAFYGEREIVGVEIPKAVTKIGENAFSGCWKIWAVTYLGNQQEWKLVTVEEGNDCLRYVNCKGIDDNPSVKPPVGPGYIPNGGTGISFIEILSDGWHTFVDEVIENIFVLNFFLILIWGALLLYNNANVSETVKKRRKLIFVVIACLQWILISGLRADTVGDDTENYMRFFDRHATLTWGELFRGIGNYFATGEMGTAWYMDMEPLFIVFNRIVAIFTTNHVVYKFLIAIIFMSALGLYVYKYSEDPCLSVILYGALFFNMFSLTGYRQVLSVAICVLWGYRFIRERKLMPFLLLLCIAYLFHRSSIAIILFYFLANKKQTKIYIVICLMAIIALFALRGPVFNILKSIMGYDEYAGNYGFKQSTFFIVFLALTIVACIQYKKIINRSPEASQYYNALILSWVVFPMVIEDPSAMRLLYMFAFALLLLVPLIVASFDREKNEKMLAYGIVYAIFCLHIIVSNIPYEFFWR